MARGLLAVRRLPGPRRRAGPGGRVRGVDGGAGPDRPGGARPGTGDDLCLTEYWTRPRMP
ncbi:hypothetical protein F9B16_28910 [Actinomadura montaniterrae]|uniref:Uncharacterized protein n=1 Tax=Actinomadura montaniterrae TaxID=1803903 RepID=A0A6L3VLM2_9ACTN|nr:hypothetical protein F9B16_28910 [Actinomadura montaniterrae]